MVVKVGIDTSALDELATLFSAEDTKVGKGETSIGTVLKIAVFEGLTQAMRFIVQRSRANAPVDTGRLRASIGAFIGKTQVVPFGQIQGFDGVRPNYKAAGFESLIQPGRLPGAGQIPEVLSGEVVATADYAFLVHETMAAGDGPGVRPRIPEETPEGGTGGKFIQRAVDRNRENILRILSESIEKTLESFAKSSSLRIPQTEARLASRLAGIGPTTGSP